MEKHKTPNPHAAEGRGGLAGGCQCLTLLSGMSRIKKKENQNYAGDGETLALQLLL